MVGCDLHSSTESTPRVGWGPPPMAQNSKLTRRTTKAAAAVRHILMSKLFLPWLGSAFHSQSDHLETSATECSPRDTAEDGTNISDSNLVRAFLQDEAGCRLSFQHYLKREYADELASLWDGVEGLLVAEPGLARAQFIEQAVLLYQAYLGPDSPHSISLALELCHELDAVLLFRNGSNSLGQAPGQVDPATVSRLLQQVKAGTEENLQPYASQYSEFHNASVSSPHSLPADDMGHSLCSGPYLLPCSTFSDDNVLLRPCSTGGRVEVGRQPRRREMKRTLGKAPQDFIQLCEDDGGPEGLSPPRRHTQGLLGHIAELGRRQGGGAGSIKRSRSSPAFMMDIARRLSGKQHSTPRSTNDAEKDQ